MPDSTAPQPEDGSEKPSHRNSINYRQAKEITIAGEVARVALLPKYATYRIDEEIDSAFVLALQAKCTEASAFLAKAGSSTTTKETTTREEDALKATLVARISAIQGRAKRKYGPDDPKRADYFIGEGIARNRNVLETSARSIFKHLETNTLPGIKPLHRTGLKAALDAYLNVQTEQATGQSDASQARIDFLGTVKEIGVLRRQIQYAVDVVWPAKNKTNAPIRVEFGLPANRSLP